MRCQFWTKDCREWVDMKYLQLFDLFSCGVESLLVIFWSLDLLFWIRVSISLSIWLGHYLAQTIFCRCIFIVDARVILKIFCSLSCSDLCLTPRFIVFFSYLAINYWPATQLPLYRLQFGADTFQLQVWWALHHPQQLSPK